MTKADLLARPDRPELLLFWGHRPESDGSAGKGCLSQWWPAELDDDGLRFRSAEHYMMFHKALLFEDQDTAARILAADDPGEAKTLGRQVKSFDSATWAARRVAIVTTGNELKFTQHPDLAAYLLGTGDRILVEASPLDAVWGIGLTADDPRATDPARWPGENLLGFALMTVRARLRAAM
ncbi:MULTISPECIES: NADAR family protein [unclassified Crossiella]|uniref:NADAR family protein n=1 Tax=unclassified Crossiella TaxID=2620835 RepID=UPI0020005892|nr:MULTISPECIES: NADAR family protein [unclassified Crossiella]MCK2241184.1 NADAR family protein [Crossiella sp. S99.2]MCK2253672.1 NADAR family protein [Crossiella sp. S99.1]